MQGEAWLSRHLAGALQRHVWRIWVAAWQIWSAQCRSPVLMHYPCTHHPGLHMPAPQVYELIRMLHCQPWWEAHYTERVELHHDRETPDLDGWHYLLRGIEFERQYKQVGEVGWPPRVGGLTAGGGGLAMVGVGFDQEGEGRLALPAAWNPF